MANPLEGLPRFFALPGEGNFKKDEKVKIFTFGIIMGRGPRVAIVEDDLDAIEVKSQILWEEHFTPRGFYVNESYHDGHYSADGRIVFKTVMDWHPRVILCDKQLGYFDGIALNGMFAAEVPTIMFSAEYNTRETHQVATEFLPKRADNNVLIDTIRKYTNEPF